jgi:uncharacterized heparinase superfamily protein
MRTCSAHRPCQTERVEAIRRGRFSVLNLTIDGADPIDWAAYRHEPRPGCAALHYFGFARELAEAGLTEPAPDDARRITGWGTHWIANNPPGAGWGWDTFAVAARLMNWALVSSVFPPEPEAVLESFARQTRHLMANIEFDVRANHLLKDACALVVAGEALGPGLGSKALAKGKDLLEREIAEQILEDGGHYERSPMYHCQVLEDLTIAYAAMNEKPEYLRDTVGRMAGFLAGIIHRDGGIPLFGDGVLDAGLPPKTLIDVARETCDITVPDPPEGSYTMEPSGFYVMQTPKARLVTKAGPPGPDYQLGHAHCDMLSYELSVDDTRVIVDSGTSAYEEDPMRAYCRGTRAHNTVSIDGREQNEFWHVFRVGRRYKPTARRWEQQDRDWLLSAGHDGFHPFHHRRSIRFHEERFWVFRDDITGPGSCAAESVIHFHPDVQVERQNGLWLARRGSIALTIVPLSQAAESLAEAEANPHQGWYCPEFGTAFPAKCLVLRKRAQCPFVIGYAVFPEALDPARIPELSRLAEDLLSASID